MEVIRTESLTKRFGATAVVENVSIRVDSGEIYGFLGLNGAGKTTTIRMLLGMIRPTTGTVALFGTALRNGRNPWHEVGYLVETPYSYPNLSVRENLEVYFRYRQLKDRSLIDEVIEKLQLGRYHDTRASHLSLGNGQRLGLAKALLHRPRLLILDEPINGLDPAGIVEVRSLLGELAGQGTTIFLSSHILTEISRVATRIGIIHQGRLLREFDTSGLRKQLIKKLLVRTGDNARAVQLLATAGYAARINADQVVEVADEAAVVAPEPIASLLVGAGVPLRELYRYEEDLEHYFLRIIGEGHGA
jgi:ABC-2 type transport system ATP-binding protein